MRGRRSVLNQQILAYSHAATFWRGIGEWPGALNRRQRDDAGRHRQQCTPFGSPAAGDVHDESVDAAPRLPRPRPHWARRARTAGARSPHPDQHRTFDVIDSPIRSRPHNVEPTRQAGKTARKPRIHEPQTPATSSLDRQRHIASTRRAAWRFPDDPSWRCERAHKEATGMVDSGVKIGRALRDAARVRWPPNG